PLSSSFGQNTFLAIYSTLSSLGFYTDERLVFLPFVKIGNSNTNVYTLYYYFIQDFGIILGLLFQFFYGNIFGTFYNYIRKRNFGRFYILIYAFISQALVMSFFAEQLFSILTTHIIRIFFAAILIVIIEFSLRLRFT
ncbi:TPA: O-antigen polymerase, partial [Streptococcus suis]